MAALTWDDTGKKLYETGISKGVLYIPNGSGVYDSGVAWNGLVSVTESPSGAEPNAQYADNSKYLNIFSAEEFAATLEAFTYPDEFQQFDGQYVPSTGVAVGQQSRGSFGLCYRTEIGSDLVGAGASGGAYKLHLMYGCKASPSEKAYSTVNDSPEGITFSWAISTTPVSVTNKNPTSLIVIDSSKQDATKLASLEGQLYGSSTLLLPTPDAVITALGAGSQIINSVAYPTYATGTHAATIPTTAHVDYYAATYGAGGTVVSAEAKKNAGALTGLNAGEWYVIRALPQAGYYFCNGLAAQWIIEYAHTAIT